MTTQEIRWNGGERLASTRLARGLTQQALAFASGMWVTQISLWENGHHRPSRASAARLAEALGCSVAYLMTGAEAPRTTDGGALATE